MPRQTLSTVRVTPGGADRDQMTFGIIRGVAIHETDHPRQQPPHTDPRNEHVHGMRSVLQQSRRTSDCDVLPLACPVAYGDRICNSAANECGRATAEEEDVTLHEPFCLGSQSTGREMLKARSPVLAYG
jgi:hypothetical protein